MESNIRYCLFTGLAGACSILGLISAIGVRLEISTWQATAFAWNLATVFLWFRGHPFTYAEIKNE
jgi:hypothetical protein